MALKLYDPVRKVFANLTPPEAGQMPMSELLLLNILIELQSISQVLMEQSPGVPSSSIEQLRTDIVSN